ncbi:hypothetical protein BD626DRAFT_562631 [Schizophyllum amplum]|uniref:Uncharacterized protein n=1 Tax=Schizophyllum amplum TaxID=97359 RepID=A0A550CVI1_9AGAR|nr:hypothetical protein BD626DRAFT_562631 [Auriculariopsis ampla]
MLRLTGGSDTSRRRHVCRGHVIDSRCRVEGHVVDIDKGGVTRWDHHASIVGDLEFVSAVRVVSVTSFGLQAVRSRPIDKGTHRAAEGRAPGNGATDRSEAALAAMQRAGAPDEEEDGAAEGRAHRDGAQRRRKLYREGGDAGAVARGARSRRLLAMGDAEERPSAAHSGGAQRRRDSTFEGEFILVQAMSIPSEAMNRLPQPARRARHRQAFHIEVLQSRRLGDEHMYRRPASELGPSTELRPRCLLTRSGVEYMYRRPASDALDFCRTFSTLSGSSLDLDAAERRTEAVLTNSTSTRSTCIPSEAMTRLGTCSTSPTSPPQDEFHDEYHTDSLHPLVALAIVRRFILIEVLKSRRLGDEYTYRLPASRKLSA